VRGFDAEVTDKSSERSRCCDLEAERGKEMDGVWSGEERVWGIVVFWELTIR